MPTYLLTSPDGKKYRVTGEGTGEEALAQLQSQLGGQTKEQPTEPQKIQGNDMGAVTSAVQGFNSVVPFGERITAGMASAALAPFTDLSMGELYDTARANQQATREASPNANLAGAVGGIAATLPLALSKATASAPVLGSVANALQKGTQATTNFVGRGGNLATKALRSAVVAAPTAATYQYGASDQDGLINPERLAETGKAAGVGAAFGLALPVAGAVAGKGLDYIGDKTAVKIAESTGEVTKDSLSKPLQKVYDRFRADYPDQAEFESVLASLGSAKDEALIQAGGKRVANLGMGSAQYPSGAAKAGEFFDEATGAAPEKLKGTLAKTISPSTNYSSDVDALLESGRAKAAPLYRDAFSSNQSVQSPIINKILQTPEGKTALGEAVKNMQNEMARVAVPDAEMTAMVKELSDIGMMDAAQGGVASGLKLKTLDYVKRSMDDTIKTAIRAGDDGQVRRITALKNSLIGEIDKADKSGLYAKARSTSGDYLSTQKAMEDGLSFLKDDVENISRRMSNMGSAEQKAYRAGVVKTLRNEIDGKYDGQNVARLFQKPATKKKLESLLSAKDYTRLLDDAKVTDDIYKLRNQIVGGSPTAGKQLASQEFQQAGQDIAVDLATGGYVRAGIKTAQNIAKKMFDGLSDQSAKEVAELLYTKDPKQKYQIIKQLLNESKRTGGGLQSTQAAQKLKAFYAVSDVVSKAKGASLPAAMGAGALVEQSPLRMTIRPSDKIPQPVPNSALPPRSDNQDYLENIKMAESGGDPNAQNPDSSASGLYQFTDQTWKDTVNKYGKEDGVTIDQKNDPQAQEKMVRRLATDNARILTRQLDKQPTKEDMYAAHFLGANDAVKLIKWQGSRKIASQLFPKAAASNKAIFFDNGRPRSVEEVYQVLASKVA